MPLTRSNVTAASRVMLPNYVIVLAWIGASWAFTGERDLIRTPALDYANRILPLSAWGLLLMWVAVLILGALFSGQRDFCRLALWVAMIVMAVFVVVFVAAAYAGDASPSAAAWPYLAACAFYASDRSLLKGEAS